jgi:hypothetical protein
MAEEPLIKRQLQVAAVRREQKECNTVLPIESTHDLRNARVIPFEDQYGRTRWVSKSWCDVKLSERQRLSPDYSGQWREVGLGKNSSGQLHLCEFVSKAGNANVLSAKFSQGEEPALGEKFWLTVKIIDI